MTQFKWMLLFYFSLVLSGCLMTRSQVETAEKDRQLQEQLQTLQKDRADQADQFTEFNEQMRQLSGRIETLENQLRVAVDEKQKIETQSQTDISNRDKKLEILQEAIAKQEQQIQSLQQELQGKKASSGSKSDKAQGPYQVAEAAFAEKDWKEAILNYQKYVDKNPKGKLVPDANYKMGVCFLELDMKDEAKTFLEEVVAKYPDSAAAKSAKNKLKKLK